MNVEIIPAILAPTLGDIESQLLRLRGAARMVQIDVVDGAFAPNITWPYTQGRSESAEGSKEALTEFEAMQSGERGMPCWEDFDFQFDLMVAHPETEAARFISAGASAVIVHARAQGARAALDLLQEYRGGEFPVAAGLALPSDAAASLFEPFSGLCDFVQVMGIEKVGFQGQPFDPRAIELVRGLRAAHPDLVIQVDGGITRENIRELALAGANRLAVGHDIVQAEDPVEELRQLAELANGVQNRSII